MKNFRFLFIAIISFGTLTACKSSKDAAQGEPTDPKATATTDIADTPAPSDSPAAEKTLFASIQRTPCFGSCPTYTMTIYSDGSVNYHGTRAVDLIGDYTTQITQKQMDAMVATAQQIGFMQLDDRYDAAVSDLPSATTTMVIDGVEKSVYRRYNYPQSLLSLEVLFDNLIKSENWTETSPPTQETER